MTLHKGYTGLVLSTVFIAILALESLCQKIPASGTADQKFLRQHFDNPKTGAGDRYCNAMMQRRDLTRPECKEKNTFIHALKDDIVKLCKEGGKDYKEGLRVSLKPFPTTTCKHMGGSMRPPCEYRGNQSQRYVVIACSSQPVHFAEGIMVTTTPWPHSVIIMPRPIEYVAILVHSPGLRLMPLILP